MSRCHHVTRASRLPSPCPAGDVDVSKAGLLSCRPQVSCPLTAAPATRHGRSEVVATAVSYLFSGKAEQ
jgi:hypothetical protein